MSPEPIINLQRRLTLVGAIRAGGEKPERGVGRKLANYRLTSPHERLIRQAAELYGGPVTQWTSPAGPEWQVYTEAEELPVLLMPSYSLRQTYELWEGATKRTRLCDGVEEELTGGPCLCNAEGNDQCDLYSRLVVALPELDTVLGWRLITRGANAAHELPAMVGLAQHLAGEAPFVPARLRISQRRGVVDGQTVRFVVPTLDLGVGYLALAGTQNDGRALPQGSPSFTPAMGRGPTVEEAMSAVATPPTPGAPTGRTTAALNPPADDELAPEPIPVDDDPAPGGQSTYSETRQTKALTDPQARKLNTLVGQLRTAGVVTTEGLYKGIAHLRETTAAELVNAVGGLGEDGEVHWAPLRDALTRPEAVQLIDWLERKEATARAAAKDDNAPQDASDEGAKPEPVPYNEFPPGY